MPDDRLFDEFGTDVREIAQPFLAGAAQEVPVPLLGLPGRFGIDQITKSGPCTAHRARREHTLRGRRGSRRS